MCSSAFVTSPWPGGKGGRIDAGMSGVRLSAGFYPDLVSWHCSCRDYSERKNEPSQMIPDLVHAHCSYKAQLKHCIKSNSAFVWHSSRLA